MQQGRELVHTETNVFWDMVDFPLPENVYISSFYGNCKSSLRHGGYVGETRILAYGRSDEDLSSPPRIPRMESIHEKIKLLLLRSRYARLTSLLLDMLNTLHYVRPPTNFMLIIKRIPEEDTELVRVLEEMKKRNYNVLLVVDDEQDYFPYLSYLQSNFTVWLWKSLVHGQGPIGPTTKSEEDDEDTSDEEGI